MPFYGEAIIGLCIALGLFGIVVPVLPGALLVVIGIMVWALIVGGAAWIVFAVAAALIAVGEIVKYVAAGRVLRRHEVPNRTIVVGGVVGVVGFFILPVVGLFLGFIVGALLSELIRTRTTAAAWRGALGATKAAAFTIGIELFASLLASGVWVAGAIAL